MNNNFNPWKYVDDFSPNQFAEKSSELQQWPIKLWKVPIVSPYFHQAHLLVAADCTAFACPEFHNIYARGKVTLTCCMESDFDIVTKLSEIILNNEIRSVTVVKTDRSCCRDLTDAVKRAAKSSRIPIPIQVSTVFINAEDVCEEDDIY